MAVMVCERSPKHVSTTLALSRRHTFDISVFAQRVRDDEAVGDCLRYLGANESSVVRDHTHSIQDVGLPPGQKQAPLSNESHHGHVMRVSGIPIQRSCSAQVRLAQAAIRKRPCTGRQAGSLMYYLTEHA